jgi:hypothetical protein
LAGPDLDFAELHVSVKNYVTQKPYVTTDGLTSLDIRYEAVDVNLSLYEPTKDELSSAHIVLPSLISNPEQRPLLQLFKEGDRVEIYDFQPDAGDPIFAGFIPPGAITEDGGKVILDALSTLVQTKWQHLRRYEYYNVAAAGLYKRAMAIWADLVNDDFSANDLGLATAGSPVTTWSPGAVTLTTATSGTAQFYSNVIDGAGGFVIAPGDSYLLECDASLQASFGASNQVQVNLRIQRRDFSNPRVESFLVYRPSGVGATPQQQVADTAIYPTTGTPYDPSAHGTTQVSFSMPQAHHLSVYIKFSDPGMAPTVTVYTYLDNVNIGVISQPWVFDSNTYEPMLFLNIASSGASDFVKVTSWRVRKLVPALLQAGRFNPQTTDAVTYQPNFEEGLQFLQLVALKDNAEYRELFHSWPATDELELDAVGTLGKNASALLGYEQPGASPAIATPEVSPFAVAADSGAFVSAPPFRFEEGWNLEEAPKLLTPANVHANDILQTGASTAEAQTFAEKWLPSEVGKPQAGVAPTYPYFEQIVNDDRVGIQTLAAILAGYELARRTDTTPSLSLKVVDELPFSGRWREGDQVFIKTQSLRNNVEQNLRVFEKKISAGSPVREVTVGRGSYGSSLDRLYREALIQNWLYDQSGTTATIYTYPSGGASINAGAASTDFTIALDQYTTGTQLVYAALHWFTDANVMNIQPVINGVGLYTTGLGGASGTDSGLVFATQYFQSPGKYNLHFLNNDASARVLVSAFLVLRVKA